MIVHDRPSCQEELLHRRLDDVRLRIRCGRKTKDLAFFRLLVMVVVAVGNMVSVDCQRHVEGG